MRAILTALELPAGSEAEIRESREKLREGERGLPPLCTAIAGRPVLLGLPGEPGFRLRLESGETLEGRAWQQDGLCTLPPVKETGYHRLEIAGQETILAVCPQRCHGIAAGTRPWGLAVQLYSPHRKGDGGIGDFTGLSQLADSAARHGADAIAISPVHAQFSADPERFSPYAPSSRLFLNVLHADPAALGADTLRAALSETGLANEPVPRDLRALRRHRRVRPLPRRGWRGAGEPCPLRGAACRTLWPRPIALALEELAGGIPRAGGLRRRRLRAGA
jgi:4-alpha-glucanotransferase